MKYTITILMLLALSRAFAGGVFAADPEANAAATLAVHVPKTDERVTQLRDFLVFHDSPMAREAGHFVAEADRLGMDWKLVAAISGVESTFGKHIPGNSYNAWGWGVFTGANSGVYFKDWKDGITQVSEGLRYHYIDKGATTIEAMGRIYAASPVWSWKVRFFLDKIEQFVPADPNLLSVTI